MKKTSMLSPPSPHPSILTYSACIVDVIIIPACRHVAPHSSLSFPRAKKRALLAPRQITQSISSAREGEGGR